MDSMYCLGLQHLSSEINMTFVHSWLFTTESKGERCKDYGTICLHPEQRHFPVSGFQNQLTHKLPDLIAGFTRLKHAGSPRQLSHKPETSFSKPVRWSCLTDSDMNAKARTSRLLYFFSKNLERLEKPVRCTSPLKPVATPRRQEIHLNLFSAHPPIWHEDGAIVSFEILWYQLQKLQCAQDPLSYPIYFRLQLLVTGVLK